MGMEEQQQLLVGLWTMMTGCSRVQPCRLRPLHGLCRSTAVWASPKVISGLSWSDGFMVGPWTEPGL